MSARILLRVFPRRGRAIIHEGNSVGTVFLLLMQSLMRTSMQRDVWGISQEYYLTDLVTFV